MSKKISELTLAGALTGTEQVEVVQSSASRRTTTQDIANLATGITGLTTNRIPKAASATTINDSEIYQNSTSIGIGTTSPDSKLHVFSNSAGAVSATTNTVLTAENNGHTYISLLAPNTSESGVMFGRPSNNVIGYIIHTSSGAGIPDAMLFGVSGSTKAYIQTNGNIGIGLLAVTAEAAAKIHAAHTSGTGLISDRYANDATASSFLIRKSRGATALSHTIVQSGDVLGSVSFQGSDGSNFIVGARMDAIVSATPGTNDMPTDLVIYTTPDGASSPTEKIRVTSDGRLYGTALHNNAGAVTGTTNQYVASGTYTPTLTNSTNIDSSTAHVCNWMRVGNVVTVSGRVDIDATAGGGAATSLGMSVPIASNFADADGNEAGGTFSSTGSVSMAGGIYADSTNDRLTFAYNSQTTSNASFFFSATYLIL